MDDYILSILLEQQEIKQEHTGEGVQKKLAESLVLGDQKNKSGQTSEIMPENESDAIHEVWLENGTGDWRAHQREQAIQMVLERIRQPEEIEMLQKMNPSNGTGQMEQTGLFGEMSVLEIPVERTGENSKVVFGRKGQEGRQSTMEPEGLSMYFQRDARRYS